MNDFIFMDGIMKKKSNPLLDALKKAGLVNPTFGSTITKPIVWEERDSVIHFNTGTAEEDAKVAGVEPPDWPYVCPIILTGLEDEKEK